MRGGVGLTPLLLYGVALNLPLSHNDRKFPGVNYSMLTTIPGTALIAVRKG